MSTTWIILLAVIVAFIGYTVWMYFYQKKLITTLSEEEFLDLREKCKFAESLKSNGDIAALSPAISKVAKMSAAPWNHWNIKKLKEKVESNG